MQQELGSSTYQNDPVLFQQLSIEQFKLIESEQHIDPRVVHGLLRGPLFQSCVVYQVKNAVPLDLCNSIRQAFGALIDQTGGTRTGDTFVNVLQIGATQFGRSALEYMNFSDATRDRVNQLFAGLTTNQRDLVVREQDLREYFTSAGSAFRPSRFAGKTACFSSTRSWRSSGSLSLLPHDDLAQLDIVRGDHFEIAEVQHVVSQNTCISAGQGGSLVVWNLAPSDALRDQLGLRGTGYPYPEDLLQGIERLEVQMNQGDVVYLASNFLHAVRSVASGNRVTMGRFIGLIEDGTAVYWT